MNWEWTQYSDLPTNYAWGIYGLWSILNWHPTDLIAARLNFLVAAPNELLE